VAEVRVNTLPKADINIYAAQHHRILIWVRLEPDAEEVVPEAKLGFDPHVSLAQGYEGRDM
jgi:hypothetical protein